jgi:hypothetical protein
VISELDGEVVLNSQILSSVEYLRQKDTIITWNDMERDQGMALSFQRTEDTRKML